MLIQINFGTGDFSNILTNCQVKHRHTTAIFSVELIILLLCVSEIFAM